MHTPDLVTASPWRADILAELMEIGRARPGLSLVAALEPLEVPGTFELVAYVRLDTPRPPDDEAAAAAIVERLGVILRQVAILYGTSGGEVCTSRTVVTVVFREGEPRPTASEEQFVRAWQACDPADGAEWGGVYVVTPEGWTCLQGGAGGEPRLVLDADSYAPDDDVIDLPPLLDRDALEDDPGVVEAEQVLAQTLLDDFPGVAAPRAGECLACYVTRMVGRFGCDESWRFVEHYEGLHGRVVPVPEWRREGACDCAIYELGFDLADDVEEPIEYTAFGIVPVAMHHEWPWPNAQPCRGVRAGTSEPCSLWQPLEAVDW